MRSRLKCNNNYRCNENIITKASTTSNSSQSGETGKEDTDMGGTGGDDNEVIRDGKDENQRENKEQEDGGDDRDKDNKPNRQIKIIDPKDMIHKEFTISHHLSTYTNYESMQEARKLTTEMQKKDPTIVFYPLNKYSYPQPRTINNITDNFLHKEHQFQEFFYTIRNNNQTKYVFIVTMVLFDTELKQEMKYYLESNKLYMNSAAIDADTLCTVGWFKNLRPDLVNFKSLKEKLMKHYDHTIMNQLDKTQKEQLNDLTDPIKVDVRFGVVKAGTKNHPLKHCAPVITCS